LPRRGERGLDGVQTDYSYRGGTIRGKGRKRGGGGVKKRRKNGPVLGGTYASIEENPDAAGKGRQRVEKGKGKEKKREPASGMRCM